MAENEPSKPVSSPGAPAKSFMTAGPTLHYSHTNVLWFWGLGLFVYVLCCLFWHALLNTNDLLLDLTSLADVSLIRLGQFVVYPISIYEYPWHILVLGTVMGILATTPVLVAQLLSFRYSLAMVLAIFFIAKLHLFGVFVLASCIAVACRPLRFRSRFISAALCMAPQLLYWAIWGSYDTDDPVKWGLSLTPWMFAWLTSLAMSGIVLGVGHFTRYKPGLVWAISFLMLLGGFFLFQKTVGFAELDYQANVAGNNPEDCRQFHDHPLSASIDAVIEDSATKSFLIGKFFPIEPILLREKLKEEIQRLIAYDTWPEWFRKKMPDDLNYQAKRRELLALYNAFMEKWPDSERVAVALYFKAMLSEYHPDTRHFGKTETLRFYSDFPFDDNYFIWQKLYDDFPQSPESLEARWRIAMYLAGQADFDKAGELCEVTLIKIRDYLKAQQEDDTAVKADSLFTAFHEPARTVMTPFKLADLEFRLKRLQSLIGKENQGTDDASGQRLGRFIGRNPHGIEYAAWLESQLADIEEADGLRDNLLLEQTMLIDDARQRMQQLTELSQTYPETDGGLRALYELAMVKVQLRKAPETTDEVKQQLLTETRSILDAFVETHPENLYAEQARSLLKGLPEE
ncbi:MAG: hypothetical protein ACYSUT_00110 [Planctomycetota bacterium]